MIMPTLSSQLSSSTVDPLVAKTAQERGTIGPMATPTPVPPMGSGPTGQQWTPQQPPQQPILSPQQQGLANLLKMLTPHADHPGMQNTINNLMKQMPQGWGGTAPALTPPLLTGLLNKPTPAPIPVTPSTDVQIQAPATSGASGTLPPVASAPGSGFLPPSKTKPNPITPGVPQVPPNQQWLYNLIVNMIKQQTQRPNPGTQNFINENMKYLPKEVGAYLTQQNTPTTPGNWGVAPQGGMQDPLKNTPMSGAQTLSNTI